MSPMATVENQAFINMIKGINALMNEVKIITRKTLVKRIEDGHKKVMTKIKDELKCVPFVCTTADIWSTSKRSYLGVTIHWINDDFTRKGAALACKRFNGSHTHDRIADLVSSIHEEFIDSEKTRIVKIVTDNGANIVKAFKSKPEVAGTSSSGSISVDIKSILNDESLRNIVEIVNEDEDSDIEDELVLSPINDDCDGVKLSEGSTCLDSVLPEHQRCACHTLNLIASNDIKKAHVNYPHTTYNRLHHTAFSKCYAIWNLTAKSPKAAEIYENVMHQSPNSPCPTRWNSTFDCLSKLLKAKQQFNELMEALKLPKFRDVEIEFLVEYIEVVGPLASTIDKLQDSKHAYFGELIPQLWKLNKIMQSLKLRQLKYCVKLVEIILESLKNRFKNYFELSACINDAILATVTHPYFKLRWAPKNKKAEFKQLLMNELETFSKRKLLHSNNDEPKSAVLPDDFSLLFEDASTDTSNSSESNASTLQLQALQYLQNNDEHISMLNAYPDVKALFIKYNTPLASSAPVERLFSYAGMVMRPKRRSMTDRNFENMLLLKANGHLVGST